MSFSSSPWYCCGDVLGTDNHFGPLPAETHCVTLPRLKVRKNSPVPLTGENADNPLPTIAFTTIVFAVAAYVAREFSWYDLTIGVRRPSVTLALA